MNHVIVHWEHGELVALESIFDAVVPGIVLTPNGWPAALRIKVTVVPIVTLIVGFALVSVYILSYTNKYSLLPTFVTVKVVGL